MQDIILSGDLIFLEDMKNLVNNINLPNNDSIRIAYGATEGLCIITSNKGKNIKYGLINITSLNNKKIFQKNPLKLIFKSNYVRLISSGVLNDNIEINKKNKKAGNIINNNNKIEMTDEGIIKFDRLFIISKEIKRF